MHPMDNTSKVWYVSYGSNMSYDRFMYYIRGGQPTGAKKSYKGCRNQTPPSEKIQHVLPNYELYFGGESKVWGGGICFIRPSKQSDKAVLTRAYLITRDQFTDIWKQENHLAVDSPIQLKLGEEDQIVGTGQYRQLLYLGEINGYPAYSFTSPEAKAPNAPVDAYLRPVISGLAETYPDFPPKFFKTYLSNSLS